MVKIAAPSALLLAIVGWALTFYIGNVLLSGTALEERACQTGCIQALFFSGLAIIAVALVFATVAALKGRTLRFLGYGALLLAAPLFAIYAGIIVIGNFA